MIVNAWPASTRSKRPGTHVIAATPDRMASTSIHEQARKIFLTFLLGYCLIRTHYHRAFAETDKKPTDFFFDDKVAHGATGLLHKEENRLEGTVAFVDPAINTKTQTIPVRVVIANESRLIRIGELAKAAISILRRCARSLPS